MWRGVLNNINVISMVSTRICIVSQRPFQNCHHDWSSNVEAHFLPSISSPMTGSVHYPNCANDCCVWRVDTACEHDEATSWCNIFISQTHVFKVDQQAYAEGRCVTVEMSTCTRVWRWKWEFVTGPFSVGNLLRGVSTQKNRNLPTHMHIHTMSDTDIPHWLMFPKFYDHFFWNKSK